MPLLPACKGCGYRHIGVCKTASLQARIAELEAEVAALREELDSWEQEFTRVLDDGCPYIQDALEAGHELADAEARARMAGQDRDALRALVAEKDRALEAARPVVIWAGGTVGTAIEKVNNEQGQHEKRILVQINEALALTEADMWTRLEEK